MNDCDREMFKWVRAFNPYDLYTKSHERPNLKELRPFYDGLINEYFQQSCGGKRYLPPSSRI